MELQNNSVKKYIFTIVDVENETADIEFADSLKKLIKKVNNRINEVEETIDYNFDLLLKIINKNTVLVITNNKNYLINIYKIINDYKGYVKVKYSYNIPKKKFKQLRFKFS